MASEAITSDDRGEAGGPAEPMEFSERKRFSRFSDDDAKLLAELRPAFERDADRFVEEFYAHLRSTPALRPFLSDPATVERLMAAQERYLISLTRGDYGEDYARSRLRIGQVHERIGMEPQWYLGTYGLYMDLLLPTLHDHFRDDPAKALRASAALSKLLLLDMQLALDAYYETRHRRELQRSEQLAAVGELAASIAHEVRNPLAGMKGALEVLRTELSVKPSNLEIVDELLAQIARLENLVRDLLTFARPSAIAVQGFDLHDMLDRLIKMYKDEAEAARITIHRVYGPGTGRISADPQQMEQVFFNLIHNSIQAMEEGGTLTVATQATRAATVISFRDTGKGVPKDDLGRIFQPFFTTKHRGSGLGLPIVKKIIETHGGFIEVDSTQGEGTAATISLPCTEEDD
jgi:signal transduction histidine kinase